MARPSGGSTVHVGKAAALIIAAVLLGVIVLRDDGSGGRRVSADVPDVDQFTTTTLGDLTDNTTTTVANVLHAKNSVKVIAVNATGTQGKGGQAQTKLSAAGYNALKAGTATQAVTNTHPVSVIYVVTAGYEADAREIAALFGLPDSAVRSPLPTPSPSPDIKPDANIVVLVGSGITL